MSRKRQSVICRYCQNAFEPMKPNQFYCSLECRFWSKVQKLGPNDCWNYLAGKTNRYGRFHYRGHHVNAHRFAWFLSYGPIPEDLWVLHKCDNPACCNPSHLFLGTHTDNMRDMGGKNRKYRIYGERNPAVKLTENQVKEIKESLTNGVKQRLLAIKYKVTESNIHYIKSGKRWSHI